MVGRVASSCVLVAAACAAWWLVAARSSLDLVPYAVGPALVGAAAMASPGAYAAWLAASDPRRRARPAVLVTLVVAAMELALTLGRVQDAVVYLLLLAVAWTVLVALHARTAAEPGPGRRAASPSRAESAGRDLGSRP